MALKYFAVVAAFIFLGVFVSMSRSNLDTRIIKVGDLNVRVEVADTEAMRERGLSDRTKLADGAGMLFVFPQKGIYGFWMKDMKFSIDIIWIDANDAVITIATDISPQTYPKFLP